MTKAEFLRRLEKIIEADEGTLGGDEPLEGLEGWDSLAVVVFVDMLDKQLGTKATIPQVRQCRTVEDLAGLAGGRVAG
jgi:acyl carrier protein